MTSVGGTANGLTVAITYGAGQPSGYVVRAGFDRLATPAVLTITLSSANVRPGTYNYAFTVQSATSGFVPVRTNRLYTVANEPIGVRAEVRSFTAAGTDAGPPIGAGGSAATSLQRAGAAGPATPERGSRPVQAPR